MSIIQSSDDGEQLYSVIYFNNGGLEEANFHAKNISDANHKCLRFFNGDRDKLIAIGLTVGCFEDKRGIYI
jgi:hypothetical protein